MSSNVTIYQIQNHVPYSFMGWNYAKDKFNMKDYTKVATYGTNKQDDNKLLNTIWDEGNNGELQSLFPKMYSVSVSNVIQIDDKYYYVDTFGFQDISESVIIA